MVVEGGGAEQFASLLREPDVHVQQRALEGLAVLCLAGHGEYAARDCLLEDGLKPVLGQLARSPDAMVSYGLASVLHNATLYVRVEMEQEREQLRRLQLATDPERAEAERGAAAIERDMQRLREERALREAQTDVFRGRMVDKGLTRVVVDLAQHCKTLAVHARVADILAALALNQRHRGRMVQDGAHKTLLTLGKHLTPLDQDQHRRASLFAPASTDAPMAQASDTAPALEVTEIKRRAAHALARIGVTTDPHLFSHGAAADMVAPLLDLVNGDSELAQFEAALAITNLAARGDDLKRSILLQHGWTLMESLCASDNPQVQRAATGALCNLVTHQLVLEAVEARTPAGLRHVRLFLVLTQAEDVETVQYAASALANLASFAPAALLIAEGEGRGLAKLAGLLGRGVQEIVHPAAHAAAVLTGHAGAQGPVGGEVVWYPPAESAKAWARELLECGALPRLLLLQEKLAEGSQALGAVGVLLNNLAFFWHTPLSVAEAITLKGGQGGTERSEGALQVGRWLTVLGDEEGPAFSS